MSSRDIEIACIYLAAIEAVLKDLTKELEAVKRLLKCEVVNGLSRRVPESGAVNPQE